MSIHFVRALALLCSIVICGCNPGASRDQAADTHLLAARKPVPPAQVPAIVSGAPRPQPPAVPRTTTIDVKIDRYVAQVYLDSGEMIAHRQACKQWHNKMVRTPRAAALMGGYQIHSACEKLADPPEYRRQVVISPEWIAYERELVEYERHNAPQQAQTSTSSQLAPDVRVDPASYSSGSSSAASAGEVHVKGYYRKDGTYVRPHARSSPRK